MLTLAVQQAVKSWAVVSTHFAYGHLTFLSPVKVEFTLILARLRLKYELVLVISIAIEL